MRSLLNEWRVFLSESKPIYGGILKLELPRIVRSEAEAMQIMLPEEAQRIDRDSLHVTLIHQSILKPFRNKIKTIEFPVPPPVILEDEVWERQSPGKKTWAVRLKNLKEMRDYVAQVMELLGSNNTNPEPERVFHVSLANLTGNPRDSVR